MNPDRDLENLLDDWLSEGPTSAPGRLLDSVLAALPTTRQGRLGERLPWRVRPAGPPARLLAVAAAAVLVLVGVAILAGPSANVASESPSTLPTAAPSPSMAVPGSIDTSSWPTFASARYGFSLRYPTGWSATAATSSWTTGRDLPDPIDYRALSPLVDAFLSPDGAFFTVASQPLPDGVDPGNWLAGYEAAGAAADPAFKECWPAPAEMAQATIDGVPAWVRTGCGATDAIAFAGGRVYVLTDEVDAILNRPLFDAFLATVRLTPSTVVDVPAFPGRSAAPSG